MKERKKGGRKETAKELLEQIQEYLSGDVSRFSEESAQAILDAIAKAIREKTSEEIMPQGLRKIIDSADYYPRM